MIKPTVGRKVWYRPSKHDKAGSAKNMTAYGDQPLDATVICVHSDRLVNLLVVDAVGNTFPKLSVTLMQEGDEPFKDSQGGIVGGFAEWMPYQQGQAKKA